MSDWQKIVKTDRYRLSFRFIPPVSVLPEFEIVERLKKIKEEQVDVVFSGTEQPAVFADHVQLNYKPDDQKKKT